MERDIPQKGLIEFCRHDCNKKSQAGNAQNPLASCTVVITFYQLMTLSLLLANRMSPHGISSISVR